MQSSSYTTDKLTPVNTRPQGITLCMECHQTGMGLYCEDNRCFKFSCEKCEAVRPCRCENVCLCAEHSRKCPSCDEWIGSCCEPHVHLKQLRQDG